MSPTLLYAAVFLFAVSFAAPEPGKKGSPDEANSAAARGQFPHHISIGLTFKTSEGTKRLEHVCSGSILSKEWILTAAHCFTFPYTEGSGEEISITPSEITRLHLTAGKENLATDEASAFEVDIPVTSESLVIHEKFGDEDQVRRAYDFALINVAELPGISFDSGLVGPIELVKQGEDPKVGDDAVVAGWGSTDNLGERVSDQLLFAKIPIKPDQNCYDTYGGAEHRYWDPKLKICAGGNDWDPHVSICQGDSGSALEVIVGGTRKLAGVISTGGRCISINPVMVARVSTVLDWIAQKTGIKST